MSSIKAEEINNPFETFSTRAIEKITPKTRPITPRIRLIRPKIVKKPSPLPAVTNNEMIKESTSSPIKYGNAFFMKTNFQFLFAIGLHNSPSHRGRTNSWFQKV
jgi:hypothetical protein